MKNIGIIGVGLMGHGIAKNLLKNGFSVTAMAHRNRSPLDNLITLGASEALSPKAIADKSSVIILCVSGSPQVEQCIYGDEGVLAGVSSGDIVIDCSTSDPASTDRIATDLAAKGAVMVDAPLARTPIEAEEGRLNTMVGAEESVLEMIRPVLMAFCENIFHVGGAGSGHKAKLVNNFLAMGQAAMTAEALCACAAIGVDLHKFQEIISLGTANSPAFQMITGGALEGDYSGVKFSVANGEKDLRYYNHLVESKNLTNTIGRSLHQSFVQGINCGHQQDYVGSLIQAQAKLNNVDIIDTEASA